jgi:threonine synthase
MAAKRGIDGAGIGCEPASAASVAGVKRMRAEGKIGAGERVVAVLTGHLLKDPAAVVESGPRAVEIEADLASFERAMAGA